MAGYGNMSRGFNTYKEVQTYQDDWGKPIITVTPDHLCRPVIIDAQGIRSPIVSYSTDNGVEGYVVRAERVVQVRRIYDTTLNGHLSEYKVHDELDSHSPRNVVHDFFDIVQNEASQPTHVSLLSPPKWSTKPSWRSEDHGSPKYSEHRDLSGKDWEKSSGSPLRNKFEASHIQDNRGYSPYTSKKDGYEKPSFTHSMDSPKDYHYKDYGVNNKWPSPPTSSHDDWDSKDDRKDHDDYSTKRGTSPYSSNKDDYGKPKYSGGYKTATPTLSQATNDIGNAMKILHEGSKPPSSPTYAQQSHFPASYSAPQKKESYPEGMQGMKPVFSPGSTQQPHVSTPNSTPQSKEGYHNGTQGFKPLFSPSSTQQPHFSTSNPTPQNRESYPNGTQGTKPLFSPGSTQQPHVSTTDPNPQNRESYPNGTQSTKPLFSPGSTTQGTKPLFSPGSTQKLHVSTTDPTPQNRESYPNGTQGIKPLFHPVPIQQPHFSTPSLTPQNKESYPNGTQGIKPLFSPGSTQQPQSPTSYSTSQNRETNPIGTQGWKPLVPPVTTQQPQPPTSNQTPQRRETYPDHETQGWKNPSLTPSSPQKHQYSERAPTPNPQMKDEYTEKIQGGKSFSSPFENTQQPGYSASIPPKKTIDSSNAKKKYGNLKPVPPTQMKYSGTIDSREAVEKYKGAFVP